MTLGHQPGLLFLQLVPVARRRIILCLKVAAIRKDGQSSVDQPQKPAGFHACALKGRSGGPCLMAKRQRTQTRGGRIGKTGSYRSKERQKLLWTSHLLVGKESASPFWRSPFAPRLPLGVDSYQLTCVPRCLHLFVDFFFQLLHEARDNVELAPCPLLGLGGGPTADKHGK